MPGLDPGIHSATSSDRLGGAGMDCRANVGNDEEKARLRLRQRPGGTAERGTP
jgi:hypothetical protein